MWDFLIENLSKGTSFSVEEILLRLILSLILSTVISMVYQKIKPRENQKSMTSALIIISVTISAAIMLIGDNLARSFGLVGAVSIIRFRSAVKSPMDMALIFLTIVLGMACGLGLFSIALIFFVIILLVVLVSWQTGLIKRHPGYHISITLPKAENNNQRIQDFLKSIAEYNQLISLGVKGKMEIWRFFIRIPLKDIDYLYKKIIDLNSQYDFTIKLESL